MNNFVHTRLPWFLTNPNPWVYFSGNFVVLDFETTSQGPEGSPLAVHRDNRIVLAVWENGLAHPRPGRNVVWGGEFDLQNLLDDINDAQFLVAHNAKFELQWLERCGLDLSNVVVWDTKIGDYVIGGNRCVGRATSLNACTRRWGLGSKTDVIGKMFAAEFDASEIPRSWLESYCIKDVALTRELFYKQLGYMAGNDKSLMPVMYTRCLATPVLADIEKNGMMLDADKVDERWQELEKRYAKLQHQLETLTKGINVNSPKQLAEFLYDTLGFEEVTDWKGNPVRTPAGERKTDAVTISKLGAKNTKQRKFIEIYSESKDVYNELTKYLRKFRECCYYSGGLLLAQFNQTQTQTHRLSSSGMEYRTQFQNFPRAYKPIFKARSDGWKIGEVDGAQLEFRVAAHLGRDQKAKQEIIDGIDVHAYTAHVMTEAGEYTTRQDAKAHTFKPLYGGTSGTPAQQEYYRAFREKYRDGITATQNKWIDEALRNKCVKTEWGLTYYFPGTKMQASGYVVNTASICNYPVQGFATAEIIPVALVYFWHYLQRSGLRMFVVNTIHDSIIVELPEDETEAFHQLSRRCFIDEVYFYLREVYGIDFTVPLGAEVSVGTHWADDEAKQSETKYEADSELY